ncbi:chemotaxis-specific protein-glutamate methyltransferase CheB [Aporhodopirellula aestuarii]|uniref:Protein-glutamate methylesterase/protein-glutamine glutaminase n=1 Tax=Aporhodopirellula aestuarii TaxID=2950107 RepID=A0ABT0U9J7_9BACT|nr:chemotaxis-specific protein-glutamate methyltransferase CheB [Aporhodopirellula aestuarii]MCM2373605.1 chemotaxis-specific protein-glutamate methyltransferase CheB [Aporhodopirellula aestuarii]
MLRLLIVDDSPTARELLAGIFALDPEIQVVGLAHNGKQGVERAQELQPDVITMDIEMPVLNGFQATKQIMTKCPTPTVIVSSNNAVHEQHVAVQAMEAGALTVLRKPWGPGTSRFQKDAHELIATVKAMAEVKVVRHHNRAPTTPPLPLPPLPNSPKSSAARIIGIASSTGGPPALVQVLSRLPSEFPVPILVVQHIAQGFTQGLVEYLDSTVTLPVQLARAGELLQNGRVYLSPDGYHLGTAVDRTACLSTQPPIDGFRPSADFLFESLATVYGPRAVGVIMTGMGHDGVEGLGKLHTAGGRVIAQDEDSCVVFGMPGSAIEAGVVDRVLPVGAIAKELLACVASRELLSDH